MKKLVMILVLGATMISCDNKPTKVEDPKTVTTVELQQLASIDSTTYKVVEKGDTVYILSTKDNMVVKQVDNDSGFVIFCITFLLVLLFVVILAAIISAR